MGRMPDFMNALVTDAALGMRDHPTLDPAHIENLQRYQRDCRANDWCLTHTLVDPQVDRSRGPGLTPLQATTRGLVKLRFLVGLAARLAEAIGRDSDPHHQLRLGELAAQVKVLAGALRGGIEEVADRLRGGTPLRALPALLFVAIPDLQMRAIDVIRRVSGSGLVMTPPRPI
jgi:aromatic ring hydroxylase